MGPSPAIGALDKAATLLKPPRPVDHLPRIALALILIVLPTGQEPELGFSRAVSATRSIIRPGPGGPLPTKSARSEVRRVLLTQRIHVVESPLKGSVGLLLK